jgi:hypothetical protein
MLLCRAGLRRGRADLECVDTMNDMQWVWRKFIRYLLAFCAILAGLTVMVRG